ncbi:MAG: sarcosine oxidase subunit delta [Deltaproteobacteria bacterium]|nr:sarcosine oxidase subunit delta [Deltaproteobacteria bacterium]MBW1961120.1 sarcosine oxidase subunit delta [Deltaproteobacteria bacterium]MBW1993604.1 sarcosine oxidase subunit delta [Deltaproteobacteria bacterium]MBW2152656.1 sarcosine oxidase subunit delta [Deltaproteobacteria bacterium]
MTLTLTCPICGKRNAYEFRYGGEEKGPPPERNNMAPEAWYSRIHANNCAAGPQKEWWNHRDGCGTWFTLHRNTLTNLEVLAPESEASKSR